MKIHTKLLAAILGISCLCGCSKQSGNNEPEPHMEIAYDVIVKPGYYLSDADDSYIVIKNDTFNLVGIDWYELCREYCPPRDVEMGETESEYEERIDESVRQEFLNQYVDQTFIPVKFVDWPEEVHHNLPYLNLATNTTAEEIIEKSNNYSYTQISMLNEDTIVCQIIDARYIYCGTSLPENLQTQTSD